MTDLKEQLRKVDIYPLNSTPYVANHIEEQVCKAVYKWLESKRNFPLSQTPDNIQITELQSDCIEETKKATL
jgi:hypothetical protein